ncbi:hypothetical protein MHYP_G00251550 [Metynnis hypsauchen]
MPALQCYAVYAAIVANTANTTVSYTANAPAWSAGLNVPLDASSLICLLLAYITAGAMRLSWCWPGCGCRGDGILSPGRCSR